MTEALDIFKDSQTEHLEELAISNPDIFIRTDLNALDALTDTGVSTNRHANEDAFLKISAKLKNKTVLIGAVFDGLGGMSKGNLASNIAASTVASELAKAKLKEFNDLKQTLKNSLQIANKKIIAKGQEVGATICSTAVVVATYEEQVYTIHSGDSRAYMIESCGNVKRLTVDHSKVEYDFLQHKIDKLPPDDAPERSKLIACLGATDDLLLTEKEHYLPPESSVIVCSDGYWGHSKFDDFYQVAFNGLDLHQSFQEMINRGSTDNITAVILRPWIANK